MIQLTASYDPYKWFWDRRKQLSLTLGAYTPKEPKANMSFQKKPFSKIDEVSFLACRMRSVRFQSMLCIWKILIEVQANFWYNLQRHTIYKNDSEAEESDFCRMFLMSQTFWEGAGGVPRGGIPLFKFWRLWSSPQYI